MRSRKRARRRALRILLSPFLPLSFFWRIYDKSWPAEWIMAWCSRVKNLWRRPRRVVCLYIFVIKQVYSASDVIEFPNDAVCVTNSAIKALAVGSPPCFNLELSSDAGRRPLPGTRTPKSLIKLIIDILQYHLEGYHCSPIPKHNVHTTNVHFYNMY